MNVKDKIKQLSGEQIDKLTKLQSGDYKKIEWNWKAIGIAGLILLVIITIILR